MMGTGLRGRILMLGLVFFTVVLATVGLGLLQTARILSVAQDGPEGAVVVSRHPSEMSQLFETEPGEFVVNAVEWQSDQPQQGTRLFQKGEPAPTVFTFDDVPPEAVDQEDLSRLAGMAEEESVGIVFFAGENFAGGEGAASWPGSPIGHLLPVTVNETAPVVEGEVKIAVENSGHSRYYALDELPNLQQLARLVPKAGAEVVISIREVGGQSLPLLVRWEIDGSRVVVWAGGYGDLHEWESSQGTGEGEVSLPKDMVRFATRTS
jgi:hypothetical protein